MLMCLLDMTWPASYVLRCVSWPLVLSALWGLGGAGGSSGWGCGCARDDGGAEGPEEWDLHVRRRGVPVEWQPGELNHHICVNSTL